MRMQLDLSITDACLLSRAGHQLFFRTIHYAGVIELAAMVPTMGSSQVLCIPEAMMRLYCLRTSCGRRALRPYRIYEPITSA